MSYNVLLKGNAKFIKIYSNSTSNSFGDDAFLDVQLNQIEKDAGASATLNSSNYEITLASNKHYVGFGFLHPLTSTAARLSQMIAVDSSNNLLSEDDGFFNSLIYEDSEYYATSNALKVISDGTTEFTTQSRNQYVTENNIFKIFKSTGNSNFTFKLRGRTQSAAYTLSTDSQLILIEMS